MTRSARNRTAREKLNAAGGGNSASAGGSKSTSNDSAPPPSNQAHHHHNLATKKSAQTARYHQQQKHEPHHRTPPTPPLNNQHLTQSEHIVDMKQDSFNVSSNTNPTSSSPPNTIASTLSPLSPSSPTLVSSTQNTPPPPQNRLSSNQHLFTDNSDNANNDSNADFSNALPPKQTDHSCSMSLTSNETNAEVTTCIQQQTNDASSRKLSTTRSASTSLSEPPSPPQPSSSSTAPTKTDPNNKDEETDLCIQDVSDMQSPRLTRLITENGTQVYIVGTAHFSQDSINDVKRVIRHVRPSAIVLELCRERLSLLTLDDDEHIEGNKNFSMKTIPSMISQHGLARGLILGFFLKMTSSLTNKLDLPPGGEFRVAVNESKNIPGCTVYMGDRSLQVTIARAVNSLSLWEKIKFLYQALSIDSFQVTKEDIEEFKNKDIIETLMSELGDEFQGIKSAILDERDLYLAHSIYGLAYRCETAIQPCSLVAVVGIGHVNGIVENWGKTTDEQICLISEVPRPSKTKVVVFKVIKFGILGLCCYGIYKGAGFTYHTVGKVISKFNSD